MSSRVPPAGGETSVSAAPIPASRPAPPADRRLEDLVESAASRHPDAIAVETAQDEPLTYRSLLAEAEGLARFLEETMAEIPPRIGLIGSKSARSYVAYLAVLKLGCTIVPINHQAPLERLLAIIRSAGVPLVLTDQPQAATAALTADAGVAVVPIPRLGDPARPNPGLARPARTKPTAYGLVHD